MILHGAIEEVKCVSKFHDGLQKNDLGLPGVVQRTHQVLHDGGLGNVKLGTPQGWESGVEDHQNTRRDEEIQMTRKSQVD